MKKTLLFVALLGSSATALAQTPDWTHISLSYLDSSFDAEGNEVDISGFGLNGSFLLQDNWVAVGQYQELSEGAASIDFTSAGVGYYKRVRANTDVYTTLTVEHLGSSADTAQGNISSGDTGFGLGVGVRSMLHPDVEVGAKADYLNIDEVSLTRLTANAMYHPSTNVGLGLGYEIYRVSDVDLDIDSLMATLRFSF